MNFKRFIKINSYAILVLLLFFVTMTFSFSNIVFNAEEVTTYTDDKNYNYTTKEENIREISEGVTYIENVGYTKRSGTTYDQVNRIFVANFNQGEEIKIATWAVLNDNGSGFRRTDLKSIAEDYEANHPGYVVLAGINADQYYFKYGTALGADGSDYFQPQPYYPMVSGGDNWFAINPYAGTYNVTGFKNDGSANPLVYGNRSVDGLYVHVYDEKMNEILKVKATDLNITSNLGSGETTVLAAYMFENQTYQDITKDSLNGLYIVEDAEMSWVSNSTAYTYKSSSHYNVNAFFGKGTISKVSNEATLKEGQFAIETRNEELKNALKEGVYVKCQYEFDSGFAGIEEAIGYHTVQRSNGKDGSVANSYNSRPYPRSIFGCDAEGKIYLITCDGSNSAPTKGMYAQESNAMMKKYGITDAFQMDGGGSVTSVFKNSDGEIEFANPAVEGSYRYILSGLFIVLKVPTVTINVETVSQTEATVSVDLDMFEGEYEKAYLKISYGDYAEYSSYYEIQDNKVEFNGLEPDTEYYYMFCYQKRGEEEITKSYLKGTFVTYKPFPVIDNVKVEVINGEYNIDITYIDEDKLMYRMYVILNGKQYNVTASEGSAKVKLSEDLGGIIDLKVKMECSFNISGKGMTYADTIVSEYDLDANAYVYMSHIAKVLNNFLDDCLK